MAPIGGSVQEVSIAGRNFTVAQDAEVSRKLGGFENEVEPNGDGTARMIKTRVAWYLNGLSISVDDSRGDHEFLQDIADGNNFVEIDITLASGAIYAGDGTITGELVYNTTRTVAAVNLSGENKLKKQA